MSETKTQPDWEAVERDYRAGLLSVREIAATFKISHTAIQKRAKSQGWERSPRPSKESPVKLDADQFGIAGFIYVIYLQDSAGERFYKIGLASSFTPRFQAHQCSSPFDICVACAYFVGNMRSEERVLHKMFETQRVRGEWFRLSDEDMGMISMRAKLV